MANRDEPTGTATVHAAGTLRAAARAAGLVLLVGLCSAVPWALAAQAWQDVEAPGPATTSSALVLGVAIAAGVAALWLLLVVALSAIAAVADVAGRRPARSRVQHVAPAAVRRAVFLLVTASLMAPAAASAATTQPVTPTPTATVSAALIPSWSGAERSSAPATPDATTAPNATPSDSPTATFTATPAATPTAEPTPTPSATLTPGWVPDPVPTPPRTSQQPDLPSPTLRPGAVQRSDVVVRRGDTLWSICARHLGPDASDAAVLESWPAWYAANRHVIGDDPNRILPGMRLRPPTAASAGSTR